MCFLSVSCSCVLILAGNLNSEVPVNLRILCPYSTENTFDIQMIDLSIVFVCFVFFPMLFSAYCLSFVYVFVCFILLKMKIALIRREVPLNLRKIILFWPTKFD